MWRLMRTSPCERTRKPAAPARYSPLSPAAHSGRIRRAGRVFAVWRRSLRGVARRDAFAGLPPTPQRVRRGGREPVRQDRERPVARWTSATPDPYTLVPIIVGWAEPLPVPDDCRALT